MASAREVRAAVQASKRARAQRLGLKHYEKFTDAQLTDSWATGLFPERADRHASGRRVHHALPAARRPIRSASTTTTSRCTATSMTRTTPCRRGWACLQGMDITGATRPGHRARAGGPAPGPGRGAGPGRRAGRRRAARGSKSRGFRGPLWSEQEQRVRPLPPRARPLRPGQEVSMGRARRQRVLRDRRALPRLRFRAPGDPEAAASRTNVCGARVAEDYADTRPSAAPMPSITYTCDVRPG